MKFNLWENYFSINRSHFDNIDWLMTDTLTAAELKLITNSIQQFQRGEHSEGKHFIRFALEMKDGDYLRSVKLFIKEEQDHAMVLGRFMDNHSIPRLRDAWLDNVFRRLRKLAGLEVTVTVLLTAEIISMVYYKALRKATKSALLRKICRQILVDEEMHLRFQSYTLRCIYNKKNRARLFFTKTARKGLMAGTIVMVWLFHKQVLQKGGYGFIRFFRSVWKEFEKTSRMIKGKDSTLPVQKDMIYAA